MNREDSLLACLYELSEDSFTKDILVPIFKALGYTYVSFNGGPYEFGVDLVAAKKDELFSNYEVIAVQSKKLNLVKGTADKTIINGLLTQLNQCKFNELEIPEAGRKKPDKVILATPGQINSRLREEVQPIAKAYEVNFLEGPQIIELILTHCPELVKKLNNINTIVADNSEAELGNTALKRALFINKQKTLSDYACDLEFFFGSRKDSSFVLSELDFLLDDISFIESDFRSFQSFNDSVITSLGFSLAEQNLDDYYENYLNTQKLYISRENKDLLKDIKNSEDELGALIEVVSNAINDAFYTKRIDANERDLMLSKIHEKGLHKSSKLWGDDMDEHLRYSSKTNVSPHLSTLLPEKFNDLYLKKKRAVNKPDIKITMDKKQIIKKIIQPTINYLDTVKEVNAAPSDNFRVRDLLVQAKNIGKIQKVLFSRQSPYAKLANRKRLLDREGTISISPSLVIDSGENIAIFGGAGFGKTTLLQFYASKCESIDSKNCVLIELSKHLATLKSQLKSTLGEEELAESFLKVILLCRGATSSDENIKYLKSFLGNKTPILLDGLDEVYSEVPIIVKAIKAFSHTFTNYQVVITSRPNMSYLDEIEFIGISLLPFTKSQLYQFIKSWCSDALTAKTLIQTVETSSSLKSTVTNPLLATIVCHLAESGIHIPQTESRIYEERIKLLTGSYDQAKGIYRQSNLPDNLVFVAEKLAFIFHMESTRQMEFTGAINKLVKECRDFLNKDAVESCLRELIEPCDILQLNKITEEITFGHFRFQESLVSQHLKRLNHYQFIEYLALDFWQGAFGLYAEQNDINAFFDIFARSEDMYNPAYYKVIDSMINLSTTDKEKRIGMRQLLDMISTSVESIGFDDDY